MKQKIQKQNYRKHNNALKRFYETGVKELHDEFEKKMNEKYPGLFDKAIGEIITLAIDEIFYICYTCNSAILKGKVPGMSHKNKNEHRSIGAKIIEYLYINIEHEKSRRTYIKMKKFCKEYLALQNPPKNILFAPGNYHSIQVTTH